MSPTQEIKFLEIRRQYLPFRCKTARKNRSLEFEDGIQEIDYEMWKTFSHDPEDPHVVTYMIRHARWYLQDLSVAAQEKYSSSLEDVSEMSSPRLVHEDDFVERILMQDVVDRVRDSFLKDRADKIMMRCAKIIDLLREGYTSAAIARECGVSASEISMEIRDFIQPAFRVALC